MKDIKADPASQTGRQGTASLTQGPIRKKIAGLTLSMMIGMISMVIFNIVDTVYIGWLGIKPLTAMSFTFPVVMFTATIALGLGVGASSVISRTIGKKQVELTQRLTTDSLLLSVTIVIGIAVIGLLTIDPLFRSMGAEGEILDLIRQYMVIWYLGVPFVVIPMVGNNAIRAAGNTFIPSMIMLTAVVVNLVLDPLLIFGLGPFPRLEIRGAAIATVIARAVTFTVSLLFLQFRFHMLTAKIPSFRQLIDSWKKVLYVGAPSAVTQSVIPLALGIITRMVSAFGPEAVAALGVSSRIEMFAMSPLRALSVVMIPFTGQNIGAERMDRVNTAVNFSWILSLVLGGATFTVLFFFGRPIGTLFNSDARVVRLVYLYLVIVSAGYGLNGISLLCDSIFNAMNLPLNSMALNFLKMFVMHIPFAWIGSRIWGLEGIFSGILASYLLAGVVSMAWMKKVLRKTSG